MDKQVIELLTCAASTDKHIVKNPKTMLCDHFVCDTCSKFPKCHICDTVSGVDYTKKNVSNTGLVLINQNLDLLFKQIHKRYESAISDHLEIDEKIENHFEFMKEQLELRIETIKCELDKLRNEYENEFQTIKNKLKEYESIFDIKKSLFRFIAVNFLLSLVKTDQLSNKIDTKFSQNDLNELKELLKDKSKQSTNLLYGFQDQIKRLNDSLAYTNKLISEIGVYISERVIDESLIGYIQSSDRYCSSVIQVDSKESNKEAASSMSVKVKVDCDPICWNIDEKRHEKLKEKFRSGSHEANELFSNSNHIQVFNNKKILIFSGNELFVYDTNLNYVKTIRNIGIVNACSINKNNEIFVVDSGSHMVKKFNTDFKELCRIGCYGDHEGQFDKPSDIYCDNKFVYVCDHYNNRIQKFSTELKFDKLFEFKNSPNKIFVFGHLALLTFDHFNSIYNLPSFVPKYNIERHYRHSIFGCLDNRLYEYCKGMFYCYNEKGEVIEEIKNDFGFKLTKHQDGRITFFNDTIIINYRLGLFTSNTIVI